MNDHYPGAADPHEDQAGGEVQLPRLARYLWRKRAALQRAWHKYALQIDDELAQCAMLQLSPVLAACCAERNRDAERALTELASDARRVGLRGDALGAFLAGLLTPLRAAAMDARFEQAHAELAALVAASAHGVLAPELDELPITELPALGEIQGEPLVDHGIIGESAAMQGLRERVSAVADAPGPVLIVGPSGTGKELVAQALHRLGAGPGAPFIPTNCATLPQELIESELFGHERGAFTGSHQSYSGLLRSADSGVLFLDEITEMSLSAQSKLLRALEQRSVRPVGSAREYPFRARVIAASNREPSAAILSGHLRADLFYRLGAHRIDTPALRSHPEDIAALLDHFCAQLTRAGYRPPSGFSAETRHVLGAYEWPGNVRELRNVVEHCCAAAPDRQVNPEHLPSFLRHAPRAKSVAPPAAFPPLHAVEREHILRALDLAAGNKARAARLLGLSRHQLYVRLARLHIP